MTMLIPRDMPPLPVLTILADDEQPTRTLNQAWTGPGDPLYLHPYRDEAVADPQHVRPLFTVLDCHHSVDDPLACWCAGDTGHLSFSVAMRWTPTHPILRFGAAS